MLCPQTKDDCKCKHPVGHSTEPHECECGGAWDDKGYVCEFPITVVEGPLKGRLVDELKPMYAALSKLLPTPQPGADWKKVDGVWKKEGEGDSTEAATR